MISTRIAVAPAERVGGPHHSAGIRCMCRSKRVPLACSTLYPPYGWRLPPCHPAAEGDPVIDYSTWPTKKLSITTLRLDPLNPRLPDVAAEPSQHDLIVDLVEHEDAAGLARDIVEQGYSPLEKLLGYVEEGGDTYVLEGNRRLTALKLLLNPDAAPESVQKRIRALAVKAADGVPKKVEVVLAPTREDAAGLIMQKHTRTQVREWEPVMQGRFFKNLLAKGKTVEQLAARYGIPAGVIRDRVRTLTMYEIACALPLPDREREIIRNPREFKISTIERLTGMPDVRKFLGVEFDGAGRVKGTVDRGEFEAAYARILSLIVAGKLDTRETNTVTTTMAFLEKYVGGLAPKTKGRFGSADFQEETSTKRAPSGAAPSTAKPGTAAPREQATLISKREKCPVTDRRIREVWDELQQLRVRDVPNATAVLVRILLELAVIRYLRKTGKEQPILEAQRRKNKKGPDWYPSLRQLLNPMIDDPNLTVHPLVLKTIRRLVEQEKGPWSLESLDQFVHSVYAPPERDIRGAWAMIADFLQFLLVEDLRPSAPSVTAGK